MYSIIAYGAMIADKGRMQPYSTALQRAIKEDSVVLDIGTGTGIFALLSCHYGARHVYAVEPDDTIQVARELADANGFSGRITFIQDLSTNITLPEKANIIVSDLRGALPAFMQHFPSIIDARKRHLAPDGILIPCRDMLRAALVEAPDLYRRFTAPWNRDEFGINMQPTMQWITNTLWSDKGNKDDYERIVGEVVTWSTVDYYTVEKPNISGDLKWRIDQHATAHGIRVWFDSILFEDIGFSNAPDQPPLIYGNLFFPWPGPVTLDAGDTVSVSLRANLVGNDYTWSWNTAVFNKNNPGKNKAEFKQSTFYGMSLSPDQLGKRASGFKPVLNQDGMIDLQVMQMMEQGLLLEDIARQISTSYPERFPGPQQALSYVADLSVKYSK